jgi:regulatory protein YycH of two-component signal transduction system YycFG
LCHIFNNHDDHQRLIIKTMAATQTWRQRLWYQIQQLIQQIVANTDQLQQQVDELVATVQQQQQQIAQLTAAVTQQQQHLALQQTQITMQRQFVVAHQTDITMLHQQLQRTRNILDNVLQDMEDW